MPRQLRRGFGLLGLSLSVVLIASCSKTNDVDLNGGGLKTGAECELTPDDPCAGACIGGICRSACGPNRECPENAQCVGDGEAAGCVPNDFGSLDLLSDCKEGCELQLAPFGREGYFYSCAGSIEVNAPPQPGEKPDINVSRSCTSTLFKEFAVRGDRLYHINPDAPCSAYGFGTVGDRTVQYYNEPNLDGQDAPITYLGYIYQEAGETYLYGGFNSGNLYRFSPEAVTEPLEDCSTEGGELVSSYPPIGEPVSEFAGFWAACPNPDDLADCAAADFSQNIDDPESGLGGPWLYIRDDGYLIDYAYTRECNGALRSDPSDPGYVLVLSNARDTLDLDARPFATVEQEGEVFLTGPFWGQTYRKVEPPAWFTFDPCDGYVPKFGF